MAAAGRGGALLGDGRRKCRSQGQVGIAGLLEGRGGRAGLGGESKRDRPQGGGLGWEGGKCVGDKRQPLLMLLFSPPDVLPSLPALQYQEQEFAQGKFSVPADKTIQASGDGPQHTTTNDLPHCSSPSLLTPYFLITISIYTLNAAVSCPSPSYRYFLPRVLS